MVSKQSKIRISKMKKLVGTGRILEVGIRTRLFGGETLDCVKEYNPDFLCNLDSERIPCDDSTFDIVIAGELIEHLQDTYGVVREFNRVLKNGGHLIISVPNVCSLVNRIRMIFGKLPTGCAMPKKRIYPENHVSDFNVSNITELLSSCGFEIEALTSNGVITRSSLITRFVPASMGETIIIKARKVIKE